MCTIDSCDGKPVAKGLCAKHYMRRRRAGDPARVRKPGRKPSPVNKALPTRARFNAALKLLHAAGKDAKPVIQRASRPNGSMNVSRLLEMAAMAYVMAKGEDG
jgi:hypothetical protein